VRAKRKEVQFEAATKTIDRAREEYEEYKSGMLRKSRDSQDPGRDREMANPSSSINCLTSRSMVGESTSFKGQPERRASAGEQKDLGSDIPLTPRSGTTLYRGSRDIQADDTGTAMMLSTAHFTPTEVARWVTHQRVQLEAGTFDHRTLSNLPPSVRNLG